MPQVPDRPQSLEGIRGWYELFNDQVKSSTLTTFARREIRRRLGELIRWYVNTANGSIPDSVSIVGLVKFESSTEKADSTQLQTLDLTDRHDRTISRRLRTSKAQAKSCIPSILRT